MPRGGAALLLLLSGCGGHAPASAPQDTALEQAASSGRQSLAYGRTRQAASQYQQAFTLALARNDAQAIGDCGYDLAVAQLAGNDAAASVATILRTRAALAARAAPGFAELDLVQAAALHRLRRDGEAEPLAMRARGTASDPATAARASYVLGLIADARGDAPGVGAAIAGLGLPKHPTPDWQAERDELAARLDLLRGRNGEAAVLAQAAAGLHRTQLEYAGMADALALAATAIGRAGSPVAAADLYLQAGQSAAARGDTANAVPWLTQALQPGASLSTRRMARDALHALSKKSPVRLRKSAARASDPVMRRPA